MDFSSHNEYFFFALHFVCALLKVENKTIKPCVPRGPWTACFFRTQAALGQARHIAHLWTGHRFPWVHAFLTFHNNSVTLKCAPPPLPSWKMFAFQDISNWESCDVKQRQPALAPFFRLSAPHPGVKFRICLNAEGWHKCVLIRVAILQLFFMPPGILISPKWKGIQICLHA